MDLSRIELGPIIRAALRNKIGAILIALQIAFTMTVVVNSWYMISERLALVERPSGMVEDELFHVVSVGIGEQFNTQSAIEEDLDLLRRTPGVHNAITTNAIPLSGSGWSMGLRVEPGEDTQSYGTAIYMVDEQAIDTMGVELVAGRNFAASDVQWRTPNSSRWPDLIIVTETLAASMFPDLAPEAVIGQTVYIENTKPQQIIGVVKKLHAPWVQWNNIEHVTLVPQKLAVGSSRYLVRTLPGQRDTMMPEIEARLADANAQRIVMNMRSMGETREQSYRLDEGLSKLLIAVMTVLLFITAVGVLGLASFSVRRRTKQIGTRRALGATQSDVLRYFLVENAMITGAGVVLGAVMTVGLNIVLVDAMSFPKIDWVGVPLGMLGLLLIGQLAVYGPARHACRVSPAVATRTV
ncbi:MAG: FtsX-like permease family protein [Pseudomonadota bacterium]